ncbi:MAG: thiolase family protein [Candidatus Melainabacteria bacterium]|nr:thiolase family protein [Candidatus Melainabacteria bacterium]
MQPVLEPVLIVGMCRTPFGQFQGALSGFSASQLASEAIKGLLKTSTLSPDDVSEVILGQVLSAHSGQAPARQAVTAAGLPVHVPAMTLNKVCGSSMKALMLAAQAVRLGDSQLVLAGGMESMSQVPYYLPSQARSGTRMGHQTLLDGMIYDGLWDLGEDCHMGQCAEALAKRDAFGRDAQDAYAAESFQRAQAAWAEGLWTDSVTPVVAKAGKTTTSVSQDEGPSKFNAERMSTLRPVFDTTGTITAANASSISDGACVLALCTEDRAKGLPVKPLAKIVAYAQYAHEPLWFTTAPVGAIQSVLSKAGWRVDEVDLFEINEAFAVVPMAAMKALGIAHSQVNVLGGAIAYGHPLGASGARIVMSLITALKARQLKRGVAAICIGGGEATAIAIECL